MSHTSSEPIATFLQLALALNEAVQTHTGLHPLLSTATYDAASDYGIDVPDWDWQTLGRKIEEAYSGLAELSAARRPFLHDLLDAFAMMVREGQGDTIAYGVRVATYLQVPGRPVDQAVIADLAEALGVALATAGYPADPAVGIREWCNAQAMTFDELAPHSERYMAEARRRTAQMIHPLTPAHHVAIHFPTDWPYRGYSDYARDYQGKVVLNGAIAWEYAGLKHLITHEAFPGHQAFSAIREARFRAGLMPVEGTLYFSNTPITPIVEGICEMGQTMLGMIEDNDDQIYDLYNRYCNAVSTNLAFACNGDGLDIAGAVEQLIAQTYVTRRFAEGYVQFMTHPLWRTSFPHYWYGSEFIRDCMQRMQGNLPELYRMVYTEPHSVQTLRAAVDRACEDAAGPAVVTTPGG